jgi:glycine/D-amino acid oxidase-like deaminating enzyme
MTPTNDYDIAIIGAGIVGLAIAHAAAIKIVQHLNQN